MLAPAGAARGCARPTRSPTAAGTATSTRSTRTRSSRGARQHPVATSTSTATAARSSRTRSARGSDKRNDGSGPTAGASSGGGGGGSVSPDEQKARDQGQRRPRGDHQRRERFAAQRGRRTARRSSPAPTACSTWPARATTSRSRCWSRSSRSACWPSRAAWWPCASACRRWRASRSCPRSRVFRSPDSGASAEQPAASGALSDRPRGGCGRARAGRRPRRLRLRRGRRHGAHAAPRSWRSLMVLLGGAAVAAAVVWGRARAAVRRHRAGRFPGAGRGHRAVGDLGRGARRSPTIEAGRTLAYLAVFAGAVAAAPAGAARRPGGRSRASCSPRWRPSPTRSPRASGPARWPRPSCRNRIGQPFQYWNAVGTTAALAMPGLLWLGSRRERQPLGPGARLSRRWAPRCSRSC